VTVFRNIPLSAPPPIRRLWVEPAGGERKSTDVEWKTVMLIYPYPKTSDLNEEVNCTEPCPAGSIPCILNNSVSYRYKKPMKQRNLENVNNQTQKSKYIIILMLIGLYNIKLKVCMHGSNAMIQHSNADPEATILNLLAAQYQGPFSQHFIFFTYKWA
jgi:hypothetical protein